MPNINVFPGIDNPQGGSTFLANLETMPNVCPICHHAVLAGPWNAQGLSTGPSIESPVEVVFRCPHADCQHLFIGYYEFIGGSGNKFKLMRLKPTEPKIDEFGETIAAVSPSFIEIYGQALTAEAHNLDQLAGMGLRKAFEFLVKDFARSNNRDRSDEILAMPLGAVINEFIDDPKLKDIAKRVTWLGNDETHYVRKWADLDVTHLKQAIRVAVLGIERVVLTDKIIAGMPDSPRKQP